MLIVYCDVCGKPIKRSPSGIKEKNYCSKECWYKSHAPRPDRKTGESLICPVCGKRVYKKRYHIGNYQTHFCSRECANAYQGRNKVTYTCKFCGKEFKKSPSSLKWGNPLYCSPECRFKDTQHLHEIAVDANLKLQKMKEPTSVERMGSQILRSLDLDFEEQVLVCKKFTVDVYVPSRRLVIQWDGDYWHCHPRFENPDYRQLRRQRLDRSQDAYLTKAGYTVLRFWESDIKKEISGESNYVSNTIRSVIHLAMTEEVGG